MAALGTSMTRKAVFRDDAKLSAQNALKQAIFRAIQNTNGVEFDDVIYVLTEQLVFWQLSYFERLNAAED